MIEQIIIEEYLNGASITKLSQKYPKFSYKKIQAILRNNNVTIRGGRKKVTLSDEELAQLKKDVEIENLLESQLQTKYKLSKETIKRIMYENDIKRPNKNKVNRKIQSNYFSIIDTPEKAYWIGFLFADGSVDAPQGNKQARIRISLQEQDKEILEKFQQELKLDSKLTYDKREGKHAYSLEFLDNQIYNDLQTYGIVPNKTYKIHNIPYDKIPKQFLPALALGLFDGDGCLTYSANFSTDVTFGFTTYYESIAIDYQNLINSFIQKENGGTRIFTSAWHVNWRGRLQVLKILDILYSNCSYHLDRKYQKYIALKNSLN